MLGLVVMSRLCPLSREILVSLGVGSVPSLAC